MIFSTLHHRHHHHNLSLWTDGMIMLLVE